MSKKKKKSNILSGITDSCPNYSNISISDLIKMYLLFGDVTNDGYNMDIELGFIPLTDRNCLNPG